MTKLILQTDGGARGNPGPAGAGIVLLDQAGKLLKAAKKFLGDNLTNNEAEYLALIFGLENLANLTQVGDEVLIKLDSELVVKQLTGVYKIKEVRLRDLAEKARAKVKELNLNQVNFAHIPREENKLADRLANEAMDGHDATHRSLS